MGLFDLPRPQGSQPRRQPHRKLPIYLLSVFVLLLYIQFYLLPQYLSVVSPESQRLSQFYTDQITAGLSQCAQVRSPKAEYSHPTAARSNPRWNPVSGQNSAVLLFNATLFNGDTILKDAVNINFSKGVIQSVDAATGSAPKSAPGLLVIDMEGRFVTPGLIDMHSHHLVYSYPMVSTNLDGNEMHPEFGPLTPFVRTLDSMRYDIGTELIASGGITTSLILPGSANIMGGEAYLVKNVNNASESGEYVIGNMLFEHGVDLGARRRYMKMACGENPSSEYHHSRMGNAWKLRQHMAKAKELLRKQDAWCLSAAAASDAADIKALAMTVGDSGISAEMLEMDSTIGMLRGKVGVNIHCYEPEDMEDMLLHSKEFGFRIQAFHHASSAWKIPELIKSSGENITVAIFSDLGLYKLEAYDANLWAGKILSDHGVPVAYKSDHGVTNAKYLMFQAAEAHSFHLPEDLALQSVTSVPARSLEIDHRVGYVKPGYDADIVVWNTNPLSIGATPLQVYVDGRPTLDFENAKKTVDTSPGKSQSPSDRSETKPEQSKMRKVFSQDIKDKVCKDQVTQNKEFIITGIKKSFLHSSPLTESSEAHTMILKDGKVTCFGTDKTCVSSVSDLEKTTINLENGYLLPGLTAVTNNLGLGEIESLEETMDGTGNPSVDVMNPESVVYAKYGVHLDGKVFKRARYGGVTKAISRPTVLGGLLIGVSTGIKTSGKRTKLNGGIFQENVALHFLIGQKDKMSTRTPSISSAVDKLRRILFENVGKDSIYGQAANGSIPVVVHIENKNDIIEMIKLKQEHKSVRMVFFGGAEAPLVAEEIAASKIPLILAPFRADPDEWEKLECLPGPPLSLSSTRVLSDAGVIFGLGIGYRESDSHIQGLLLEASWAAKYAGLSEQAAVDLVSTRIEDMLGLVNHNDEDHASSVINGDFVIYEGNPLEFGASVVVSVEIGDGGGIVDCFPDV